MPTDPSKTDLEKTLRGLENVLSRPPFEGLKAILDCLSPDRKMLGNAIFEANTYVELLAKLGYRLIVTRQIHVQDCYSRIGPDGGIRAVLPYYDIPTQNSLPTLVNFDATVTTTPKSVAFFDPLLLELKKQLNAQS